MGKKKKKKTRSVIISQSTEKKQEEGGKRFSSSFKVTKRGEKTWSNTEKIPANEREREREVTTTTTIWYIGGALLWSTFQAGTFHFGTHLKGR
jgi:hypothetical protein